MKYGIRLFAISVELVPTVFSCGVRLEYKGFYREIFEYLSIATQPKAILTTIANGLKLLTEPCQVRVIVRQKWLEDVYRGISFDKRSIESYSNYDLLKLVLETKHIVSIQYAERGYSERQTLDILEKRMLNSEVSQLEIA